MFKAFCFIFGGLGIFVWGMTIMSEGLQELAGKRLKNLMATMTKNRILGILSGFMTTSLIQSSSATTVMLVSFVNAGLITLAGAVPVIMGANIGTTVTGWIVALFGFKVTIKYIALLCCGFGFFMSYFSKDPTKKKAAKFLRGFGILFLGLEFMKEAFHDHRALDQNQSFIEFIGKYSVMQGDFLNLFICIAVGALFTMIFQSSSAMMAATMVLASSGILDFPTACAVILGENIGTTITAMWASIGTNLNARRTAFIHLIFNVMGVIWMVMVFWWFATIFVDSVAPGNPYESMNNDGLLIFPDVISHLALFHTLFNLCNTIIFFPLVGILNKLAIMTVRGNKDDEFHLRFIDSTVSYPASVAVDQAHEEVLNM